MVYKAPKEGKASRIDNALAKFVQAESDCTVDVLTSVSNKIRHMYVLHHGHSH